MLDPNSSALIVWDMQVGIVARAHNGESVSQGVSRLVTGVRDCGSTVVWSQHVAPKLLDTTSVGLWTLMRRQGVSRVTDVRPYMQAGSEDVEFLAGFQPAPDELVIQKSTPSFFIGTPLEQRLRARSINTLVLAGVATEQGIEFTARHALALGFFVVVAEDAVGSFTAEGHDLGLAFLRTVVEVAPISSILSALKGITPS
jgi:nicotinamidase-related amidase